MASGEIQQLSSAFNPTGRNWNEKAVRSFCGRDMSNNPAAAICSNRRSLYLRRRNKDGRREWCAPRVHTCASNPGRRNLLSAAGLTLRGPSAGRTKEKLSPTEIAARGLLSWPRWPTTDIKDAHRRGVLFGCRSRSAHTQRPSSQSYPLKVNNLHHVVLSRTKIRRRLLDLTRFSSGRSRISTLAQT